MADDHDVLRVLRDIMDHPLFLANAVPPSAVAEFERLMHDLMTSGFQHSQKKVNLIARRSMYSNISLLRAVRYTTGSSNTKDTVKFAAELFKLQFPEAFQKFMDVEYDHKKMTEMFELMNSLNESHSEDLMPQEGFYYMKLEENEKADALMRILNGTNFDQAIIFVDSVANLFDVNKLLTKNNVSSVMVHEKLDPEDRQSRYQQFKSLKPRVLIAAKIVDICLYTQGTNVVINYDMPELLYDYTYRVMCVGDFCDNALSISFSTSRNDGLLLKAVGKCWTPIAELAKDMDPTSYGKLAVKPTPVKHYYKVVLEGKKNVRRRELKTILSMLPSQSIIIFVNSEETYNKVKKYAKRRVRVHYKLPEVERQELYETVKEGYKANVSRRYFNTSKGFKNATKLSHFDNIAEFVINYDMPKTIDDYFNRARCAHDFNAGGTVISFISDMREAFMVDLIKERLNKTLDELPDDFSGTSGTGGSSSTMPEPDVFLPEPATKEDMSFMCVVKNDSKFSQKIIPFRSADAFKSILPDLFPSYCNVNLSSYGRPAYPLQGHYYMKLGENEKPETLLGILEDAKFDQVIIFVNSVASCETFSDSLNEIDIPCVAIHDELSAEERQTRYQTFKDAKPRILITTNFVNICLYIQGTNMVINYDMPNDEFDYINRVLCVGNFCDKNLSISFVTNQRHDLLFNRVGAHYMALIPSLPDIDPSSYVDLAAKPNLVQQYYKEVPQSAKLSLLFTILHNSRCKNPVIFTNSASTCSIIKHALNIANSSPFFYQAFQNLIVARKPPRFNNTSRYVINYDMPKSTDEYFYRARCAGDLWHGGTVISFLTDEGDADMLNLVRRTFNTRIFNLQEENYQWCSKTYEANLRL